MKNKEPVIDIVKFINDTLLSELKKAVGEDEYKKMEEYNTKLQVDHLKEVV